MQRMIVQPEFMATSLILFHFSGVSHRHTWGIHGIPFVCFTPVHRSFATYIGINQDLWEIERKLSSFPHSPDMELRAFSALSRESHPHPHPPPPNVHSASAGLTHLSLVYQDWATLQEHSGHLGWDTKKGQELVDLGCPSSHRALQSHVMMPKDQRPLPCFNE